MDNVTFLEENNVPFKRTSKDSKSNKYGERLLSLCKNMDLLIANGRCGIDQSVDHTTCDDASIVDYVLCSIEIISQFNKFEVLPFCNLLSDKHNPINFAFNTYNG